VEWAGQWYRWPPWQSRGPWFKSWPEGGAAAEIWILAPRGGGGLLRPGRLERYNLSETREASPRFEPILAS
jgi:hypothetical protein